MNQLKPVLALFTVVVVVVCSGCGGEHDHKDHDHSHKDHAHKDHGHKDEKSTDGHHHEAKFGGALVGLGDHNAHVEFKIDEVQKKFFMYIWDGEVENAIRIKQPTVVVQLKDGPKLTLSAQANENTGETVGDSSTFSCLLDELKGQAEFDATIESVEVKGEPFKGVPFNYPHGTEEKTH